VLAAAGFTIGGWLVAHNQKGPTCVRPGLDPQPTTSALASPLRFTF
jgi:hypothetical protein